MNFKLPPKQLADFFLTEDERKSGVWASVCAHLDRMIEKKRQENDNPKLTDVETATLRGHLACLKAIRALGNEPPAMAVTVARSGARPDYGAKYG